MTRDSVATGRSRFSQRNLSTILSGTRGVVRLIYPGTASGFLMLKDEASIQADTPLRMTLLVDWIEDLKRTLPLR
jgi:hypothetical protein